MSKRDWIKLAVIAAVLAAAVLLVARIEGSRGSAETEVVERAVRDAAMTCYAVEGAYPAEVRYLREHYQLAYDEERYLVVYNAEMENVLPEIRVLKRGEDGR